MRLPLRRALILSVLVLLSSANGRRMMIDLSYIRKMREDYGNMEEEYRFW